MSDDVLPDFLWCFGIIDKSRLFSCGIPDNVHRPAGCFSQAVLLEARAKSSEFLEHAFKPGDAELNAVSHGLSGTQSW
ncbi:hypothetical protein CSB96_4699 [Pseudomonas aeruginosa]|nr:hypothetical protein CSB96_4699 [Pseudomonas aeruginosa]